MFSNCGKNNDLITKLKFTENIVKKIRTTALGIVRNKSEDMTDTLSKSFQKNVAGLYPNKAQSSTNQTKKFILNKHSKFFTTRQPIKFSSDKSTAYMSVTGRASRSQ
jgi:hypothetical protein